MYGYPAVILAEPAATWGILILCIACDRKIPPVQVECVHVCACVYIYVWLYGRKTTTMQHMYVQAAAGVYYNNHHIMCMYIIYLSGA